MSLDFSSVPAPTPWPNVNARLLGVGAGLPIQPLDRLAHFNDVEFERFTLEWAKGYLAKRVPGVYEIQWRGGAGDKGRDIIIWFDPPDVSPRRCWLYQCKHYESYDSVSHLLSVLHQAGVNTLDGASYTYDPAGNRTAKTNYLNGTTWNYTYDAIYELTQVTQGASTKESFSYDAVGNRLSSSSVPTYSYNASNELTSDSVGSYTYDANGNTLSDPSGKSYTWDFENRLVSTTVPGTGTVNFKYDPFSRRIEKISPSFTSIFVYDGVNLIETVNASGSEIASYTQTQKIDETLAELRSSTTDYYAADGLGSITSLSNSTGALANTYTFDSFGNTTASTGTVRNYFQYTGREFDPETGLYEYRARYYDPTIGRFISEDPLQFDGDDNFYAYTANNPVLYIDPLGLVRYNFGPPRTVPVTGQTAAALNCLEHCLQCLTNNNNLNLLVTGGAEQTGHSKNSYHYRGEAVDISYSNPVSTNDVFRCAENCGFQAGGAEPKKHHWHLQLTPGNGSRPLPMVLAPVPNSCCH